MTRPAIEIAEEFILNTNKNIFLTGKAGTGKTTFLKTILTKTKKKTIVVAPTGVAAINAGGMTIHSTFQLPPATFIPSIDFVDPNIALNRRELFKKQRLRKERRQLLHEVELLIIDEISMVRADLLDAIDASMQRIKGNSQSFGGSQVLFIGDLYQLSPVIRGSDSNILSKYYAGPYFFNSLAWRKGRGLTIELTKVYRQKDGQFIEILNRIRNGNSTDADISNLNLNLDKQLGGSGIITLTTHNKKANRINQQRMNDLDAPVIILNAMVEGKFPENSYPNREVLHIKIGAQIMFIKNHSEGLYYNGMMGKVVKYTNEILTIEPSNGLPEIAISRTEWVNSQFKVNPDTKEINKEEIGSFRQYPIKLAWAVTVHKSQGLTFDRIILDLENTFATGQLYVALSRCTSIEGISLTSPINMRNVLVDQRVHSFMMDQYPPYHIDEILKKAKIEYDNEQIIKAFKIKDLRTGFNKWKEIIKQKHLIENKEVFLISKELNILIKTLGEISEKFVMQIRQLLANGNEEILIGRVRKGLNYFNEYIHSKMIKTLETHQEQVKRQGVLKVYRNACAELRSDLWIKIEGFYDLSFRGINVHNGPVKYKRVKIFKPKKLKKPKPKRKKGDSASESLRMFKEGKTINEVAKERELAKSTIEGHLAQALKKKEIMVGEVMDGIKAKKIWEAMDKDVELPMSEVLYKIPFEVTYTELRFVRAWQEGLSNQSIRSED